MIEHQLVQIQQNLTRSDQTKDEIEEFINILMGQIDVDTRLLTSIDFFSLKVRSPFKLFGICDRFDVKNRKYVESTTPSDPQPKIALKDQKMRSPLST